MHASKDSMWRGMWKILQNSWGTKLDLDYNKAIGLVLYTYETACRDQDQLAQIFMEIGFSISGALVNHLAGGIFDVHCLQIQFWLGPCLVPQFSPNFTMQKEDSLLHQNVGKCIEY
jgi:hypothetical protein